MTHCLKNCKDWLDYGVPLSTPSDEAAKLLDGVILQFIRRYPDPQFGGLEQTLNSALEADPYLVMGHVFKFLCHVPDDGVTLVDPSVRQLFDAFKSSVSGATPTDYEQRHIKAIERLAHGDYEGACLAWERCLVSYPRDLLSLKFAYGHNLYLGESRLLRDLPTTALRHHRPVDPAYGYILGMQAFGLEECNFYDRAEKAAKEALTFNRTDSWATHSLAHVYEMTGRFKEGQEFLTSTINDWKDEHSLSCHNHWHSALFHLEQMDTQGVLDIVDRELLPRVQRPEVVMFNLLDASSILKRLEIVGVDVGRERWSAVNEACKKQPKHVFSINDFHMMLSLTAAEDREGEKGLTESLQAFIASQPQATVSKRGHLTSSVCQALSVYGREDYETTVELLWPLRYEWGRLGGSHAQLDVLNLVLIDAAIKSSNSEHHQVALDLLRGRISDKSSSPLSERLLQRVTTLEH